MSGCKEKKEREKLVPQVQKDIWNCGKPRRKKKTRGKHRLGEEEEKKRKYK